MTDVLPEGAGIGVDGTLTAPVKLPPMLDPGVTTKGVSLDADPTGADDTDDTFEAYPEETDAVSGRLATKFISVGVVRAGEVKASTSYKQHKIRSGSSNPATNLLTL